MPRGALLWWRFRADSLKSPHVQWTVYFTNGQPYAPGGEGDILRPKRLTVATETLRQEGGQHYGVSPIITADVSGHYKYGVRLEDLKDKSELGDEDPRLIVL